MTPIIKKEKKDSAVSPVVGVMLMLVVTILIAAVIASFAGGLLSSNAERAPNVVYDVQLKEVSVVVPDTENHQQLQYYIPDFTIEQLSGDSIPLKDLAISLTWSNATGIHSHKYLPTYDYGINFKTISGIHNWTMGSGNATMYLNGHPNVDPINQSTVAFKTLDYLQTGSDYAHGEKTSNGAAMTGNPFLDVIFRGTWKDTNSYAQYDSDTGIWHGGIWEDLGESVHITITDIPTNYVIYDKDVPVERSSSKTKEV